MTHTTHPDHTFARLLYLGHASLRLVTPEDKVIYIDPYAGTGYDLPADLILVTHDHYDHSDLAKIQNRRPDCQIITEKEALAGGEHHTFDLGYVKIEAVEAGYNPNHSVKSCVGYILTLSGGITIYVAGDTSITPQMSEFAARHLDYAFFPCDGVYNMDVKEASKAAAIVQARHSIPYHMLPGADFSAEIAAAFTAPGKLVLKNGAEISLT